METESDERQVFIDRHKKNVKPAAEVFYNRLRKLDGAVYYQEY